MADSEKMLEDELTPLEQSPFVHEKKSSDDLIEELSRHRTWKYTLLVFSISLTILISPLNVYITSFAGIDPKAGDIWSCVSEKCEYMTSANTSLLQEFPCDITEIVDGKEELVFGPSDIEWHLERTSFSVEFDLYCNVGSRPAQKTLLSSMYFPGALSGLIVGGCLFDNVGRQKVASAAYFLSFLVHLSATFCHNFQLLLAIRFFAGFFEFVGTTGFFVLQLELMPASYRNYINGFAGIMWAAGYPIAAAVGYFVHDWNYMYLAAAIIGILTRVHTFVFVIESPRFYLIKNDVKSAKKSFKALAALTTANLNLDETDIIDAGKAGERQQNMKQQFMELIKYPILLKETLLLMFLWFFIAMFFYGFNFGWAKIVPNTYLGYLFGGLGEFISACITVPVIHKLGRRRAMMIFHSGAALVFLIAIPEVEIGNGWTLEGVCCLVCVTFISTSFQGIYLWTGEIAPTSHRGFAYAAGSGAARVGSFLGPYIFNNLAPVTHRAVPFGIQSFASLLCAFAAFLLVETGDKEIACVAADVEARRKGYRYRI